MGMARKASSTRKGRIAIVEAGIFPPFQDGLRVRGSPALAAETEQKA